jgi:microcystin degradation protein MlrC
MAWGRGSRAPPATRRAHREAIATRRAASPSRSRARTRRWSALSRPARLVALLDPADNPFSGGIADTPGLLRVLLDAAARARRLRLPARSAAVEAARIVGVGHVRTAPLAARSRPPSARRSRSAGSSSGSRTDAS